DRKDRRAQLELDATHELSIAVPPVLSARPATQDRDELAFREPHSPANSAIPRNSRPDRVVFFVQPDLELLVRRRPKRAFVGGVRRTELQQLQDKLRNGVLLSQPWCLPRERSQRNKQ